MHKTGDLRFKSKLRHKYFSQYLNEFNSSSFGKYSRAPILSSKLRDEERGGRGEGQAAGL